MERLARVVPLGLAVLALAGGWWAAWQLRTLPGTTPEIWQTAILVVEFLLLTAFGRYYTIRAREQPLYQPLAALLRFGGILALAAALQFAALRLGWRWAGLAVGALSALALLLMGGEYLLRALRRCAVLTPMGLGRHWLSYVAEGASGAFRQGVFARILDYQFGYRFSQTWGYRFAARVAAPFVLAIAGLLWGLSAVVIVGPEEEAVLERWGRPRASGWQLSGGWHWKWPWPVETVRRFPARRIQSIAIGAAIPAGEAAAGTAVLWHAPLEDKPALFLTPAQSWSGPASMPPAAAVTGMPSSLIQLRARVEYLVTNLPAYSYHFADPPQALAHGFWRSFVCRIAGADWLALLTSNQQALAQAVCADLQAEADRLQMGVRVASVSLQGLQPPAAMAPAFQQAAAAQIEQATLRRQGEIWAQREVPLARARAQAKTTTAAAYRIRRVELAAAEARRFESSRQAYLASPEVFTMRQRMGVLTAALARARKYVLLGAAPREVLQFDLQKRAAPELWELAPAPETPEGKK